MNGTLLQKLPNPFITEKGNAVTTGEEWELRREEIKKLVLDLGYGGMPPEPESTEGTLLAASRNSGIQTYLVTAEAGGRRLGFELRLYIPPLEENKKYPVVLEGDGCWPCLTEKIIESLNRRKIIVAQFNRCAIVRDVDNNDEVIKSPLYQFYPGISSGSVAGWAWGFSRCIDVLEKLSFVDPRNIAITGHSRGGKAVLVAGAADGRPSVINPNCSGAGGCGCWRYRVGNMDDRANRNEVLADLLDSFPNWMGQGMRKYRGREAELPFDQHYLKALAAPRYFLQTDGLLDTWTNPPGTYGTLMAAREVYRFLGKADHILVHYRNGAHAHDPEDFELLADIIDCVRNGTAPAKDLLQDPYPEMREIFDWKCP
jgi:hypothetical protein